MHFDSILSNPDQVKVFPSCLLDRDPWHLVAENLEIPKEPNYLGDIGDLATSLSYLSFNLRIRHTDLRVLHFIHKALAKTRRAKMFVWMLQKCMSLFEKIAVLD